VLAVFCVVSIGLALADSAGNGPVAASGMGDVMQPQQTATSTPTSTPTNTRTPTQTSTATSTATGTLRPMLDVTDAPLAICGGLVMGNTQTGANNVSRYSCQPTWDEGGPELVYRIELMHSQPITAMLHTLDPDFDLFLLDSAYPEDCLAAGETNFIVNLQPGTHYYLVVDGFQGAAGAFRLHLTCPFEARQATATPTPTPSATPTITPTPSPGPSPTPTNTGTPRQTYLPLLLRP
jgi:hypothetical protein